MKKFILPFLLLAVCAPARANKVIAYEQVEITEAAVKKVDDKVRVTFDIRVEKFPANSKVRLEPTLYNDQGQVLELEPVTVAGRRKAITDTRRGKPNRGDVRIVKGRTPQTLVYTAEVPFEEWMQHVNVATDREAEGCCIPVVLGTKVLAADKLLYYNVNPAFSTAKLDYELTELEKYDIENPFLHPMEDYEKRYDILLKDRNKGTAAVTFKVGSHVIDMSDRANTDALEAISKAFDLIEADPNAILKHIMVAGYASPEGSLAANTRLAQNRAEAVKTFLQTRLRGNSDHLFEIYNGREDWDGLREQVAGSFLEQKDEILAIIDGYPMEDETRKTRLRQLDGGRPYRYMLDHFYPSLRSAGYVQVYYEIDRRATVATAVMTSDGRSTWIDPDSPANRGVTAINKAIDLMVEHRFAEALALLEEFSEDSRAWNHIGACYMMMGEYDRAGEYLERAAANGDADARENLEQIQWALKVEK